MLSEKFQNFLFSFGLIFIGLFLVFFGSVTFNRKEADIKFFPKAQARKDYGGDITAVALPASKPLVPLQKDKDILDKNKFTAEAILVVDDETNTVLYDKNSSVVRPLASITKLMSALVLLDLHLDSATTTKITAADFENSSHFVNMGEEFTVDDLWHIALIGSSNSAINCLARCSGLTTAQFASLMNKKAQEMRLGSANFVEPTGLDERNVASAWDVAKILKAALEKEKIKSVLQIGEYYANPLNQEKKRRIYSTNWLLTHWVPSSYDKLSIAGKTGYIADSKYNFTVRLENEKQHAVRVVILGADSNEARFTEARDVANWVFTHYLWPNDEGYDKLAE